MPRLSERSSLCLPICHQPSGKGKGRFFRRGNKSLSPGFEWQVLRVTEARQAIRHPKRTDARWQNDGVSANHEARRATPRSRNHGSRTRFRSSRLLDRWTTRSPESEICGIGLLLQRETVTRKNVAGINVASFRGLLFSRLNKSSSSLCKSAARPFFSAASKAFIVGP